MIRIELRKAGSGYACRAAGHAGYGPAGSDIVCAAVSALLWTLLMGWERLEKEKAEEEKEYAEKMAKATGNDKKFPTAFELAFKQAMNKKES